MLNYSNTWWVIMNVFLYAFLPCKAIVFLSLVIVPTYVQAAPGDLDASFGNGGSIVANISEGRDVSTSVAVQKNGKIVVAGFSNSGGSLYKFALTRYNLDGSLDKDFGEDGVVLTKIGLLNSQAFSVMVQPDGKIIAVGSTNTKNTSKDVAIVRYTSTGEKDTTFGVDGISITSINKYSNFASSAALQLNGKIVVGADFSNGKDNDIAVLRYNTDGTLDKSFGGNGIVKTTLSDTDDEVRGIVVQSDGKIVVAGSSRNSQNYYDIAAIRYNENGTIDTTFGTNGSVTTAVTHRVGQMDDRDDHAAGIALQPDSKIVIAGYSYKDFVVIRYTADGKLDESFRGNGKLFTSVSPAKDEARGVVIQPDGKIVVVGKSIGSEGEDKTLGSSSMDIAVIRINPDGKLDQSFGVGGHVTTALGVNYDVAHSAALQPDGKLIVAGYSKSSNYNFAVLRYDLENWDITPNSIALDSDSYIFRDDMVLNTNTFESGLGDRLSVPVIMEIRGNLSGIDNGTFASRISYIGATRTLPSKFINSSSNGSLVTSLKITAGGLHAANNSSLLLGNTISRTYPVVEKPFFLRNGGLSIYLGIIIFLGIFWLLWNKRTLKKFK